MPIDPIRTKADHEKNLSHIDRLMRLDNMRKLDRKGHAELDARVTLAHAYEEKNEPVPGGNDPIEIVQFVMEQKGLSAADLVRMGVFSARSRASEKLGYRKRLKLGEIRNLHRLLDIPLELLIDEYELAA